MARSEIRQLERFAALVSLATASGAVGGVVSFLIQNLFAWIGLQRLAHVTWVPEFSQWALYASVFWGAVAGLVFLINLRFTRNFFLRALIYGLLPAFVHLFIFYPLINHHGWAGWDYGGATGIFVLFYYTVSWAIPAYAWFINTSRETVGEEAAQPLLADV